MLLCPDVSPCMVLERDSQGDNLGEQVKHMTGQRKELFPQQHSFFL